MMPSKKISILHLIDSVGHGGAEVVFFNLIGMLDVDRYDHHVILPEKGWLYRRMIGLGGVHVYLYDGRGRFNLKYIYHLLVMVKKYNIDVVHSHLFGTSLYSSLASFLSRVPVICTFHGFIDIPEDRWLTHLKLNLIGMLATKIVTVSCSLQDYMTSMTAMWKKKYVTIYNGVDLNHKSKLSRVDARKNLGFPDDIIIVGAVGNIKKAKRYDILIRTAQKVVSEIPNCMFLIAGNHSNPVYKELVELQKDLSVESAVHFLGYQEDVSGFLKALDVFVLSSDSEGFSLAIIEAMIGLIPVVASKCGGPQEIVTHNVDGLLIEIGDDKGLAEGVLSVLNSRVLRETLIDNAAKTVHERFSVKTMLNSYEAVYENLVYQIK